MKSRLITAGAVVAVALSAILVGLWLVASSRTRQIMVRGSRWELAIQGPWLVADNQPQLQSEHETWAKTFFGAGRFDGHDATMSETTERSHVFAIPVPAPITVLIVSVIIVASIVRRKDRQFRAGIPVIAEEQSGEASVLLATARGAAALLFVAATVVGITTATLYLRSERSAQTTRIIWNGMHYDVTSAAGRLRVDRAHIDRMENAIIKSETSKLTALRAREEQLGLRRELLRRQWTDGPEGSNALDDAGKQIDQERAALLTEFATARPPVPDLTPFGSQEIRYDRVLLIAVCSAVLALGIRMLLRGSRRSVLTGSWIGRTCLFRTALWVLPLGLAMLLIADYRHPVALEVVGRKQLWAVDFSSARLTWNNGPQSAAENTLQALRREEISRIEEPLNRYNVRSNWGHGPILGSLPPYYAPLAKYTNLLNSQTVTASPAVAKSRWLAPFIPLLIALALLRPAIVVWRVLRVERRTRRGVCGNCAYDLRGSSGSCPECGTLIQTSGVAG